MPIRDGGLHGNESEMNCIINAHERSQNSNNRALDYPSIISRLKKKRIEIVHHSTFECMYILLSLSRRPPENIHVRNQVDVSRGAESREEEIEGEGGER